MTEQTGEVQVEVADNPERGRFELRDGSHVIGVANYALVQGDSSGDGHARDRVVFFHTEVRPEYEGQGLAARLAAFALDQTVAAGRAIVALCPYIKLYLRRHPEPYAAYVLAPTRADVAAADRAAGRAAAAAG
jgi:hypothetical protein